MNEALHLFFNKQDVALTYEDVRLKPNYSEILPNDADLTTRFSRNMLLGIPIVSAAMDTVTEAPMAIAMALYGGLGIIHKNLPPEKQAKQVNRVKLYLNGRIDIPICIKASESLQNVLNMREKHRYSFHTFPVIDEQGRLVGLITQTEFDFATDLHRPVSEIMTSREDLITASQGTSISDAYQRMLTEKKKVLPLLDTDGKVAGMYVLSDLKRILSNHSSCNVDNAGHLRVAAAVGVGDGALERASLLAAKHCDLFVVGTAHGDSKNVHDTVKELKRLYPHIDVVAGNISTGEAARRLVNIGTDGILVGQGPGSICTTRVVAGIGNPQVTAVYQCAKEILGSGVPVCADGGINNSGDITVALGVGAESVILGRLLAGTEEAPGDTSMIDGVRVKSYRGMGSLGAMQASSSSRQQYRQEEGAGKLVPEGIEGVVPYLGSVRDVLDQQIGGVRSGMGYTGAHNLDALRRTAQLIRISAAGRAESHPHDVRMIKDAPNYNRR